MGIPTVGVLSGYTNGSITTYDYSVEFAELNLSLAALALELEKLNITMMLNLGPLGMEIPGTVSNSLMGSKLLLSQLAGGTDLLNDKNSQMSMVMKGLQGSVDAMSSAIHEQVAVQTLQVADQIEHNSFQKQATLDALKRNDLPAPVPPAPMDEIKAKIKNAEIIHAEALMVSTVSSLTDNILAKLSDYILTSGPVVYAKELADKAWNYVYDNVAGLFDVVPKKPIAAANKVQRQFIQAGQNPPNPMA
jgi:hypothetical protein